MISELFNQGYYTENELKEQGFKSLGENVRIAKGCTIIGIENISIGNNVRIDPYCSIIAAGTGQLRLGSFIHIGAFCHLSAGEGIVLDNFTNLSQRVSIYSRSDDYSGEHMTNPLVPERYTGYTRGQVTLKRHVIIGAGSVILPGIIIGEGCSVGALSLVKTSLDSWGIYAGCPVQRLKERSKQLLKLEKQFLDETGAQIETPHSKKGAV
jgi:acetyltransferase-like isoleucine patch superfamily enzyme